jgi:hypothetical protein
MIGKNPLWVAKQHGHSVQTMLEVYAAWTEGAKAADIEAIKREIESVSRRHLVPNVVLQNVVPRIAQAGTLPLQAPGFATITPPGHPRPSASCGNIRKSNGGERGIRTLEGLLTLTPLAGVRLRPLGHLSVSECRRRRVAAQSY